MRGVSAGVLTPWKKYVAVHTARIKDAVRASLGQLQSAPIFSRSSVDREFTLSGVVRAGAMEGRLRKWVGRNQAMGGAPRKTALDLWPLSLLRITTVEDVRELWIMVVMELLGVATVAVEEIRVMLSVRQA